MTSTNPSFALHVIIIFRMEISKADLIETKQPVCTLEYYAESDLVYAGSYCLLDGEASERIGTGKYHY